MHFSKSERCYDAQSVWYYFLQKDDCITRFSYMHECTFKFLKFLAISLGILANIVFISGMATDDLKLFMNKIKSLTHE